ncbi:hypothetical protein CsatB_005522 [Cannabis sativa]
MASSSSTLLLPLGKSPFDSSQGICSRKFSSGVVRCSNLELKASNCDEIKLSKRRREVIGLMLGASSLFVESFAANGAGLPPEDKPKLCDVACEKELENVCISRSVKERTANANDFVNGGSHVMEYGSRSIRAEKLYLYQKLPNLNSIAGVSLIGSVTAVGYCTLIWVVSVSKGTLPGVSYNPIEAKTDLRQFFDVLNALGIIAFAFRGHNLILEIQSTMPSSEKRPSRIPMWRGVKFSYFLIAMCLFPLAIGGYWAYGQKIPEQGGMLTALYAFHSRDTSQFILGLTSLLVIINAVSSFQIYGMPIFDDMESLYTRRTKKPCPWWLRAVFRIMFGFSCFFVAVAIPFLGSLAGLIGGIALPVTLAYPCFMWLKIKKPKMCSSIWLLNWALGLLGMALSVFLTAAGVYVIIDTGIHANFFKPQ